MLVRDLFDDALTYAKHERDDIHYIGEALPAPSQVATTVSSGTTPSVGGSSVPAREDHIHDLVVDMSNYYTKAEADAIHAGLGGGGSSTLAGLTDTTITSPTDKQVLEWDSTSGTWIDGLDITALVLANATNFQVDSATVLIDATTDYTDIGATLGLYLWTDGGDIDLDASTASAINLLGGTEIDLTAPTVDINGTTIVDIDGVAVEIAATNELDLTAATIDMNSTTLIDIDGVAVNLDTTGDISVNTTGGTSDISLYAAGTGYFGSDGDMSVESQSNDLLLSGVKAVSVNPWHTAGYDIVAVSEVTGSGAQNLDLNAGANSVFKVTMTGNTTLSFIDLPSHATLSTEETVITVYLIGAYTPTWPSAVKWPGGTAPTHTSPSVYQFRTIDGGTTWYGVELGTNMS